MNWFDNILDAGGPFGMTMRRRTALGTAFWNAVVDKHPNGSWWHRSDWIDYCMAYKGGTDYSFAILHDKKVVALYPILVEGDRMALGGNPLVPALTTPKMSDQFSGWANSVGRRLVNFIALHDYVTTGEMMLPPIPSGPFPNDLKLGEDDDESTNASFHTRVVDLRMPEADRWKTVRKSYHQLIRRGQEQYAIKHHSTAYCRTTHPIDQYHNLHLRAYGEVRSAKTFDLQEQFIKNGQAHLYFASEMGSGEVVGATLWYVHNGMAYYASGIYTKDNVAHVALWKSMHDLATKGVQFAELGWQGRAADDKGKAIEFFKRGLGGTDWPVPCMKRTFLTHKQEAAS